MVKDGILYLRGVVAPAVCAELRDLYGRFGHQGSQRDYNGNRVIFYRDLPPGQRGTLGLLALRSRGFLRDWFNVQPEVESVFIGKLGPGNQHEPHYDNVKPDGVTPNHTPHRTFSSLFYVSSEFEGGEIVFPRQNRTIKPEEGAFVAFPSGAPFLHHVNPVTSGARYSVPVWFTEDKSRVLRMG